MQTKVINTRLLAAFSVLILFALIVVPVIAQQIDDQNVTSGTTPATSATTPAASAPTPVSTPGAISLPNTIPPPNWFSTGMVLALIGLLAFLFWLLIRYSHQLDQTSYLGQLYKESILEIERKRITSPISQKFYNQEYHAEVRNDDTWLANNPIPEIPPDLQDKGMTEGMYIQMEPQDPSYTSKLKYDSKKWNWDKKVEKEATRRYNKDLEKSYALASERIEEAVKDTDLSVLRGRGPEFVLEFTTVVVIIIAAVILGVLQILDTQQIGTLLAAIAGYVLGRATTRTKEGTPPSPQPAAPDVVGIINAARATPVQQESQTTQEPREPAVIPPPTTGQPKT